MFGVNFQTRVKAVVLILVGGAYVTDTIFLWEDVHSYVGHHEIFTGISGPQDGSKGLTNVVEMFEQFFDQHIFIKLWVRPITMHSISKISETVFFPSGWGVNQWHPMTAKEEGPTPFWFH